MHPISPNCTHSSSTPSKNVPSSGARAFASMAPPAGSRRAGSAISAERMKRLIINSSTCMAARLIHILALPAMSSALRAPAPARAPFAFRKLDHVVLRCRDAQRMLDFYVGVLGAEPDRIGRMSGCLSHLRIGASMIDLQAYDAPAARQLHAGGTGFAEGAPLPARDAEAGTLDHFAIAVEPYDPEPTRAYLAEKGHPVFSEGERYGADGNGYSMYVRDPEGNVVELKSSAGAAGASSGTVGA